MPDLNQPALFPGEHVVNVASVPQRSPFRYPGGKTWLVPRLRRWLLSRDPKPAELVETFCGGGIIGLTVAFEELAERVVMVERDDQVAAVWRTILGGGAEDLANRIVSFDLSLESVREVLDSLPASDLDLAFRTIIANRTKRGGILAPGASLIKAGENGKGLRSRWYPDTLARRIRAIAEPAVRERITFVHGDGFEAMRERAERPDVAYFIDPPYTVAAKRLYNDWDVDHAGLFDLAGAVSGDFLMTYDNDERVRSLSAEHGFDAREVAMKNTHHAKITELLIGRDLAWLDG